MSKIRTRFAPSPTGYLHIGGARTALFAWLFARHFNGVFILRIEDTDRERSTDESVAAILQAMDWLNLDYDEGPFYQTARFDRYREAIDKLLVEGSAYRCRCSKERLEQLREEQIANKQKPRYDGHCRDLNLADTGEPFVVRFRNPQEGIVTFDDLIRGTISVSNNELDDLIIARSDGTPTYNFTVAVDDWDMQITHVIRGDDHINNTPRQINILQALGAPIPTYAHLPMILGSDGQRLSKRHGAVSVMEFRDQGFLPDALLNYLVRLGWSHGDQELFTRDEMIHYFDVSHISRSPAAINPEKLLWINQQYFKNLAPEKIVPALTEQLDRLGVTVTQQPALEAIIKIQAERSKTLVEMAKNSIYFYQDQITYDEVAVAKHLTADIRPVLKKFREALEKLSDWQAEKIHAVLVETATMGQLKLGALAQPVRVAVTGGTISPSLDKTLELIGRDRVLQRLGSIK